MWVTRKYLDCVIADTVGRQEWCKLLQDVQKLRGRVTKLEEKLEEVASPTEGK